MKNLQTRFLASFGMTIRVVLFSAMTLSAGEIRQTVGDGAFIAKAGQSQEEIFQFDLPAIPEGSRIDFAGLVL